MSLFRKTALDALSTPERLNQPLQLLRPSQWLLLISLGSFSLTILLWSILGKIPVRISGKGVLIRPNSLSVVQSETSGQVLDVPTQVGDCLEQGEQMARIDPVSQDIEIKAAKTRLYQMISQDSTQDALGEKQLQLLQSDVERIRHLSDIGAISTDEINQRSRRLTQLRYDIKAANNRREQNIQEQRNQINSRQEEIERLSIIRAPISGCVVDRGIHIGEVVQSGSTLFTIQNQTDSKTLESLVFFPARDAKRLQIGQRVRVSPTTTKQQRHGGIEGEITSINVLPIRDDAVIKRLGVRSLLESVRGPQAAPLIEVSTSLQRDPNTVSGYDWGGGEGPNIQITTGTTTNVRVLVEERRPISYVIPILRDLTGIY